MKIKKKNKRILWILFSVLVIAGVVILGGGWFLNQRQQNALAEANPKAGDIVTAFIGVLSTRASASGQLLPKQEARLALGIAGRVEMVYVRVGDEVKAGDVLVQLESDGLQRAVKSAEQNLAIQEASLAEMSKGADEKDIAAARASVANAQAQLDDLLAGPSGEELAQAEAALVSAQTRLGDLLAGPSEEELAQAQAALVSAKAALEAAEARYEALDDQLVVAQNDIHNAQLAIDNAQDTYNLLVWNDWKAGVSWAPYSPQAAALKNAQINHDVAVANYTLTEMNINDSVYRGAQAQVAQAEANLAALTEEKTVQIASARSQVARAETNLAALTEEKTVQIANARAQLARAKANLANLLDGASEEQLAIAEAQVEQARISLQEAQDNLGNATLVAPFDGMVTDVYVGVGEWATGLAVELVNTGSLEVVLDVDEVDIGTIAVGQPTIITLETWPDQELPGEVTSIAPKAKIQAGIVSYEVHIGFVVGDSSPLPIRTGMTANAELITSQRENVLLVPNRAIIADREASKYYVNKIEADTIKKVEVTIGLRDNHYTEITSGLQEGDKLMIGEITEELELGPGRGGGMGIMGGGHG